MEKINYDQLYDLEMFESLRLVHSESKEMVTKKIYTRVPGG